MNTIWMMNHDYDVLIFDYRGYGLSEGEPEPRGVYEDSLAFLNYSFAEYKKLGYEGKLYLKQGYYNYSYVFLSDYKKGGDQTLTEGNHWETENDYSIYVYHRQRGTYYDQLIAVKRLNSRRK
jgi:pimeloyl-ACP methyl ester carboxylesterase